MNEASMVNESSENREEKNELVKQKPMLVSACLFGVSGVLHDISTSK